MSSDIRLSTEFWSHPKTIKLVRRLGLEGVRSLQILWLWSRVNRPDGVLSNMDSEDIEIAAQWMDKPGTFVNEALTIRWLDINDAVYSLHDWQQHNPWSAESKSRGDKARFSRMAKTHPELYQELRDKGFSSITSEVYKEIVFVNESLTNVNENLTPAPSPSPAHNVKKNIGANNGQNQIPLAEVDRISSPTPEIERIGTEIGNGSEMGRCQDAAEILNIEEHHGKEGNTGNSCGFFYETGVIAEHGVFHDGDGRYSGQAYFPGPRETDHREERTGQTESGFGGAGGVGERAVARLGDRAGNLQGGVEELGARAEGETQGSGKTNFGFRDSSSSDLHPHRNLSAVSELVSGRSGGAAPGSEGSDFEAGRESFSVVKTDSNLARKISLGAPEIRGAEGRAEGSAIGPDGQDARLVGKADQGNAGKTFPGGTEFCRPKRGAGPGSGVAADGAAPGRRTVGGIGGKGGLHQGVVGSGRGRCSEQVDSGNSGISPGETGQIPEKIERAGKGHANLQSVQPEAEVATNPKSSNGGAKTARKKASPVISQEAMELATWLAEDILREDELYQDLRNGKKIITIQRWAGDIDKINRLDGRPWEVIGGVLRWARGHHFWRNNIESGGKFRKKFSRLYSEAGGKDMGKNGSQTLTPNRQNRKSKSEEFNEFFEKEMNDYEEYVIGRFKPADDQGSPDQIICDLPRQAGGFQKS